MKKVDALITGGGVAGLFLLAGLRRQGYNAYLLETNQIGNKQTLASQGMIHGGIKYALNGALNAHSEAIKDMPDRWRAMLNGTDPLVHLANTQTYSDFQYLWSTASLASKFTGFFAAKFLRGRIEALAEEHFPTALKHSDFKGKVYKIMDVVIKTETLIQDLAEQHKDYILKIKGVSQVHTQPESTQVRLVLDDQETMNIECQRLFLSAGEGNAPLLELAGLADQCPQQIRPLKQVLVKAPNLPELFGHCIGTSSKPKITVSSHSNANGETIWYLGGDVAEQYGLSDEAQATLADEKLKEIFPWMDWSQAEYKHHVINRAEPLQKNKDKPEAAHFKAFGSLAVAWPTKLALAPNLMDQALKWMDQSKCEASWKDELNELPLAPFGQAPWADF
jgi:glycerol-3-phosphate dehydrogenase